MDKVMLEDKRWWSQLRGFARVQALTIDDRMLPLEPSPVWKGSPRFLWLKP